MGITEAMGQSEAFLHFQERLSRAAPCNRPLLLMGERGTGKELAASRIHFLSTRWQESFVTLNCAALTPSLIESELFGYERGAFTGADRRRIGRFEMADGGTLFLDEIGNIPMEVQEKILRVVEYGTFERVGSSKSEEVDVRIVAATNVDLPRLALEGRFKQDLLDRLSFEVLILPPLRERKGDIRLLAKYFASRMGVELRRRELPDFTRESMSLLESYPWPGNIRELKNVVERAVYRSDSPRISEIDFNPFRPTSSADAPEGFKKTGVRTHPLASLVDQPFEDAVLGFKIFLLRKALEKAKYNQRDAARLLGISYHQFRGFYRKVRGEIDSASPSHSV
jgi:psp operon transcriptional activator